MTADIDVAKLVSDLTLEEKASLCLGSDFWHTQSVERLGIPSVMVTDGPHGLRKQPENGDHVGIGGSLPATCFPTASALGSSWDPDLVRRVGEAVGREAREQDVAVVLGPGINIKRSPLCGRNFEYFSEDPAVSGALGAALVEGLQSQGVGASVKHFAANNQETDRMRVSADVDERTLREVYLPAFERVVTQAKPWTVMCAYNRVNGIHASEHRWLLTEVLRDEWGFDGLVVSDWGAVHDRVAALAAGLDLEMPPNLGLSDVAIVEAVKSGALAESVLDTAVARVLEVVRKSQQAQEQVQVDWDAHHALARVVAQQCAVLLKNDGGLLPLELHRGARSTTGAPPNDGRPYRLAVVGEFARTPRYQGAGSSQVNPTRVEVALEELRAGVPDGVEVVFAAGFTIEPDPSAAAGLADQAVAVATDADVVVAFLGLPARDESEGFDRTDIDLPPAQRDLLARLAAANPHLVVVLANGSSVAVADWVEHAPAVLECWLSGQAAGGAVADLLLGSANPSGRLAETIPVRLQDNSSYLNFPGEAGHVRYGEGVFVGYRGYDALDQEVAFPFGHGLSYTTFAHSDLVVDVRGSAADGDLAVDVACRVTNTGARDGVETVQLYVGDPEASVARPKHELKAFAKVALAAGTSSVVRLSLTARDLSYWSVEHGSWVLEGGDFTIAVGASSRDLRLVTTVDVPAPSVAAALSGASTLEEWLADPNGRAALEKAVGTDADGRPAGILGNAELMIVIGNFPLRTLLAFPGLGIDRETFEAVTGQAPT
jgi:beta-glucosidase